MIFLKDGSIQNMHFVVSSESVVGKIMSGIAKAPKKVCKIFPFFIIIDQ